MDVEKLSKKYKIGNIEMPLRVPKNQEYIYDRAAENAEKILTHWRNELSKYSSEYQLVYALLSVALQLEEAREIQQESNDRLDDLNKSIADFLKEMNE